VTSATPPHCLAYPLGNASHCFAWLLHTRIRPGRTRFPAHNADLGAKPFEFHQCPQVIEPLRPSIVCGFPSSSTCNSPTIHIVTSEHFSLFGIFQPSVTRYRRSVTTSPTIHALRVYSTLPLGARLGAVTLDTVTRTHARQTRVIEE
jgi:hypothetical protein